MNFSMTALLNMVSVAADCGISEEAAHGLPDGRVRGVSVAGGRRRGRRRVGGRLVRGAPPLDSHAGRGLAPRAGRRAPLPPAAPGHRAAAAQPRRVKDTLSARGRRRHATGVRRATASRHPPRRFALPSPPWARFPHHPADLGLRHGLLVSRFLPPLLARHAQRHRRLPGGHRARLALAQAVTFSASSPAPRR